MRNGRKCTSVTVVLLLATGVEMVEVMAAVGVEEVEEMMMTIVLSLVIRVEEFLTLA
jgi:hypothetical protein